jgi:CarD family transcriptional regulator
VSFQVGDKVIYPNHGLGVVEKVEEKTILGTTCGFFHLRILSNETTVLVPVANVDNVGLRRAITDEEVERLFELLGDGQIDNHANWKGRFKDNSDKMRSGSIYDMADVLKSLTFLAKSKSLSFREKRMLDRAKSLIVSEVSEVMRVTAEEIESRVEKALERCFVVKATLPKQPPRPVVPTPPVSAQPPLSAPVAPAPKPMAIAKPMSLPKAVVAMPPVRSTAPIRAMAADKAAARPATKATAAPKKVAAKPAIKAVKSAKPAAKAAKPIKTVKVVGKAAAAKVTVKAGASKVRQARAS